MRVAVVGAGASGLAVAERLCQRHDVTVIDRIPTAGGVLPYDFPPIVALERACVAGGTRFALGTTALRWEGKRLLLAGPEGIRWTPADHLVYAGGVRPATAAEVGLAGSRLAGVLSATVAVHLAEAEVVIGRRVVIVGGGNWAERATEELGHSGCEITHVVPKGEAIRCRSRQLYDGWAALEARGAGRVSELIIGNEEARRRLVCDAVILAGHLKALRNVDGAVFGGEHVSFVQPLEGDATFDTVVQHARESVPSIEATIDGGAG